MVRTNIWRKLVLVGAIPWMTLLGSGAIAAEPDVKTANPVNTNDVTQIAPTVGMEQVRSVSQTAPLDEASANSIPVAPGMLQATSVSQLTDVKPTDWAVSSVAVFSRALWLYCGLSR